MRFDRQRVPMRLVREGRVLSCPSSAHARHPVSMLSRRLSQSEIVSPGTRPLQRALDEVDIPRGPTS